MNIKDYLHLYLGCRIRMYNEVTLLWSKWRPLTPNDLLLVYSYNRKVEIALRPLSSMTDEEVADIAVNVFSVTPHLIDYSLEDIKNSIVNNEMFVVGAAEDEYYTAPSLCGYELSALTFFELTRYLLSKHFDIFKLIDAGLAIDKTTIK